MKIETGVMLIKENRAWGIVYEDGQVTEYGWVPIENGIVYTCSINTPISDLTWKGAMHLSKMKEGELKSVERRTEVVAFGEVK